MWQPNGVAGTVSCIPQKKEKKRKDEQNELKQAGVNKLNKQTRTSPLKAVNHHQACDHHLEEEVVGQNGTGHVAVLRLLLLFLAGTGLSASVRWEIKHDEVEVLQHRLAERGQLRLHQTSAAENEKQKFTRSNTS